MNARPVSGQGSGIGSQAEGVVVCLMVEVSRYESMRASGSLLANGLGSAGAAPPLSMPDLSRRSVDVRSQDGFLGIASCGLKAFS